MTDIGSSTAPTEPTTAARGRSRRRIRDDRAWLIAALVMNLLFGWSGEEASSVAWLNPLLFVAALIVRTLDARRGVRRWQLTGWRAAVAMITVGWIASMVVEFTIAAGGDGFGGMHPDTVPSFILAQGYYLPAATFSLMAIRRYGLDTRRAFFFAGTLAWWEAVTVGAAAILSPFFVIAPLLIAYYFSTYALCGMAGLLLVDAGNLAGRAALPISDRRLLGLGVLAGALSWTIFMGWAIVSSRVFGFSL